MSRLSQLVQLPGIRNAIETKLLHSNAHALAAVDPTNSNISYYVRKMKTPPVFSKNNGYVNLNQLSKIPYANSGTYYIINEHYDDKKFLIVLHTDENPIVIPFSREATNKITYKYKQHRFSSIKSLIIYYCRINPEIVINGQHGNNVESHITVLKQGGNHRLTKRSRRTKRTKRTRRTRKN